MRLLAAVGVAAALAGCQSLGGAVPRSLADIDLEGVDWGSAPVAPDEWAPVPTGPEARFDSDATETCLDPAEVVPEMLDGLDALADGPMLFDQRGERAALAQWIAPSSRTRASWCGAVPTTAGSRS